MKTNFRKVAKISLVLVYIVIAAGAIVRMTGSGMGCPDWPKCFGYYIPPTDSSELEWSPNREFKKGQVIIVDEALQVASKDFKTSSNYVKNNWETYTKHKYSTFNPIHTWIEYINRLATVLLGIPMLLMLFFSFWWYQKDRVVTIASVLTIIVLGLQAVLGKFVVDTNLKPTMISIHMILALVILLMLIFLIHRTGKPSKFLKYNKNLISLFVIASVITFVQILMGIQVRQFIDLQIDLLGEKATNLWLRDPTLQFYVHRSFSILVVLFNFYIAYRIYTFSLGYTKINWVLLLILTTVISGIAMNYLNFPFASQPIHLVLASLLFGAQFYLVLQAIKSKRSHKTL